MKKIFFIIIFILFLTIFTLASCKKVPKEPIVAGFDNITSEVNFSETTNFGYSFFLNRDVDFFNITQVNVEENGFQRDHITFNIENLGSKNYRGFYSYYLNIEINHEIELNTITFLNIELYSQKYQENYNLVPKFLKFNKIPNNTKYLQLSGFGVALLKDYIFSLSENINFEIDEVISTNKDVKVKKFFTSEKKLVLVLEFNHDYDIFTNFIINLKNGNKLYIYETIKNLKLSHKDIYNKIDKSIK